MTDWTQRIEELTNEYVGRDYLGSGKGLERRIFGIQVKRLMNEYAIERLEELKEVKRHPQWGTEPHYVAHEDIEAMQERLAKGGEL